jgi:amino acid adenylation domain-containing protein
MLRKNIDKSEELTIVARQSFKEREYWSKKLSGAPSGTCFPRYFKRTGTEADVERRMESLEFQLPPDSAAKILKLCNQSDRRLYMILISALFVLLDGYSGNRDIIIGMPVEKQEIEGDFINTVLAVRNHWQENASFKELLLKTRKIILEAIENQNYPIEMLLYDLGIEPDEKEFPLFHIAALLENIHEKKFLTPFRLNMIFVFNRRADHIEGFVEYNRLYYEKTYVNQIIRHFIALLKKVLTNMDEPLNEICILSGEEKKQLLYTFNNRHRLDSAETGAKGKTIQGFFETAVERDVHRIALIHEDTHLSYQELDEKANGFAFVFRSKGVKTDVLVGMIVQRSIEMITAMLGILKAGGAYLPIDPDYPQDRIEYIINDSRVTLLVTNTNQAENVNFKGGWLRLDREVDHRGKISNKIGYYNTSGCAYVIYTSGSTGRPKGVVIEHRSIVNTLYWRKNYYQFSQKDTVLQIPSYSFDSSVEDIFTPLISGAKMVLLKGENPYEIQELSKIIMKFLVTHFLITPNFYKIFIQGIGENLKHFKTITLAGESFTEELVKEHFDKLNTVELYNEYGPSENAVCTTVYQFTPNRTQVLIGKPINNVNCYILDRRLELVPIGVPGQLSLSGDGLARGYLNRPELTAEKFNHHLNEKFLWGGARCFTGAVFSKRGSATPTHSRSARCPTLGSSSQKFTEKTKLHKVLLKNAPPGHRRQRLYLTGDLARWLFDGNIEFSGRIDHQVKIRGYRIELGEIESHLLKYPGLREVVVVVRQDARDDKFICAYFVSDSEYEISGLREYLAKALPEYMIPSFFVRLEKIPLTPNGKLDRKALPGPELKVGHGFTAPGDEIEKKLAAIWSEVLDLEKEKISMNDNFFHLGGHSLKATIMADIIYKELKVKIPLAQIFTTPFIRGLSAYVKTLTRGTQKPVEPVEKKEYYVLATSQEQLYIAQCLEPDNTAYNLPALYPLPGWINTAELDIYFKKLIHRHESLRTSFHMMADKPVQKVYDQVEFEIEKGQSLVNYQGRDEVPSPIKVEKIIKNFIRPFELSQAPLLRVGLLTPLHTLSDLRERHQRDAYNSQEGKENQYLLIVDMHHIISDEISLNTMVREFLALAAGETLAPLPIQYKDFACWQELDQTRQTIQHQSGYWLGQLKEKIPGMNLPLDFPRRDHFYLDGNTLAFSLEKPQEQGLKKLAKDENVTPFILLLAIFNVMLAKICAQEDIVVGTVVAGRRHADLRHIIGFFVNQLVLISSPKKEKTFSHFLKEVKDQVLTAFENQDYPLEELLEQLGIKRKPGHHPLFDVVFTLNRLETNNDRQDQKETQREIAVQYNVKNPTAKYDLVMACLERGDTLSFSIEYAARLFKEETIRRFIGYFKEIAIAVLQDKHIHLGDIQLSSYLVKTKTGPFHRNLEDFEI